MVRGRPYTLRGYEVGSVACGVFPVVSAEVSVLPSRLLSTFGRKYQIIARVSLSKEQGLL